MCAPWCMLKIAPHYHRSPSRLWSCDDNAGNLVVCCVSRKIEQYFDSMVAIEWQHTSIRTQLMLISVCVSNYKWPMRDKTVQIVCRQNAVVTCIVTKALDSNYRTNMHGTPYQPAHTQPPQTSKYTFELHGKVAAKWKKNGNSIPITKKHLSVSRWINCST